MMTTYLRNWRWFLFSLCALTGAGYVYLLVTTPVYTVQAAILIRNEQEGDSEESVLKELKFFSPRRVIENEVKIIQSFTLMKKVVEKLKLSTRYYEDAVVSKREIYKESPIELLIEQPKVNLYGAELRAELINDGEVRLNGKIYPVNKSIATPYGQLRLSTHQQSDHAYNVVYIRVMPLHDAVQSYLKNLKVMPSSKTSSVIELSIEDAVLRKGEDLIGQLITEYNVATIDDKNQAVASTLNFIKDRLALVSNQVATVEKSLENYKSDNGITDIGTDANALLEQVQKNDIALNQTTMQLSALADAENYIKEEDRSQRSSLPATLGLGDPTLIALFNRLTDLELQRDNLIQTTSEQNPFLKSIASQIASSRKNIDETIAFHKKNLTGTYEQLRDRNTRYEELVRAVPRKERTLVNITRQQVIKNNLYTYLLQKQEEITLTYASIESSIRLVDPPYGNPIPVKPNRQLIMLLFGSLGLLIPAVIITVRNMIDERVVGRNDIDESLHIPVIGELIETKDKHPNLMNGVTYSIVAEQIRALRTKLQSHQKNNNSLVLLITSGISGEGKSFLCLNLSSSLALLNQPTVMLEMDFRKPDLHGQLDVPNTVGLSDYLHGEAELADIIRPVSGSSAHYFISCGTVTPNPAELLINSRLAHLFSELRERFTYIVVDAPPIGLVTDAELIAPHADLTLYVIRYNVTPKHSLRDVDSLYKEKRLPQLSLVLNSADTSRMYSQQYYKRNGLKTT